MYFILLITATITVFFLCLLALRGARFIIKQFRHHSWQELVSFVSANPLSRFLRLKRRERQGEKELPSLIDSLRLYVTGGSNLEGAVRRAARTVPGIWGDELKLLTSRLDMGLPFESTLSAMANHWSIPSFSRFILALKQSQMLGASLSATLAVQARILRSRRKQRAEELARLAAVKIAVPLVLCIFPALMIIYLAPALLRLLGGL